MRSGQLNTPNAPSTPCAARNGATGVTAVAHRGAPYAARENTLASFRAAVAAGADAVELDVRLTRDGVPVVLHDRTLERLWGHDVPLARLTAEQLAGTAPGVPTLAAALEVTRDVRTLVDLPDPAAAPAAVAAVRDAGAGERVYYCGGPRAMRAVRTADPAAELALTWNRAAPVRATLLDELRPRWLNYRFGLVTGALVAWAHGEGYLVSAWTADWPRTMRRLAGRGVDAITTNDVTRLLRTVTR
ncbi:glycerophosphodiester phosphodiesterase [Streptomyces boncukensis]|uniref:Glycerophosphodiester phosphodiesterase n=1 Tax=Streptomyces boncukensis TaxID=2711219 RepID=A0A6G4WU14_9ACTN|nr:glycerophosphodiester phosphodiesterase [Streptomyces boncukensis]NGO68130.1 glycerophosphodiester phosphodiesterase [Streptomyces boncukensis]